MSGRVKTVTTINGRMVKQGRGAVSVFDNGLLYAEGLFETMLAIDNRAIFWDEHLKRLYKGTAVTGLKLSIEADELTRWMKKTLRAHPSRLTKLRLTITAGESARWVGAQGKPQVIFGAAEHQMPVEPFKLHVSRFHVDQDSIFRRIKTISYAIHAAALSQAKRAGCDDALMLNEKEQVAEVTSANIFWVKKDRIYTTPLASGCLDGVTRKIVLRELKKLQYNPVERNCNLTTLAKADEVFITSSLKLVAAVALIQNGRERYRFDSGPITQEISHHLRRMVGLE